MYAVAQSLRDLARKIYSFSELLVKTSASFSDDSCDAEGRTKNLLLAAITDSTTKLHHPLPTEYLLYSARTLRNQ